MKPETRFRQKVDQDLKKFPNSTWFSIQQSSLRGTPDKLGCINGYFIALELKADEKSPVSKLQKYYLDKISETGGFAYVVHPKNWLQIQIELWRLAND